MTQKCVQELETKLETNNRHKIYLTKKKNITSFKVFNNFLHFHHNKLYIENKNSQSFIEATC